ncbi:MAG: metal-dependent transcriptional regulator [Planctomycetes bacterium]|nr:metal-dependent transcriptional regulator [Planctomycetota bacterium]
MGAVLSAALEDYLGVIFHLQQEKRFALVRDIADRSNVAKSAVTSALRTLSERGMVNYKPYEPVTLSAKGNEQAEWLMLRRQILEDFLTNILGLDPDRVSVTACDMEHAVDRESMERFICFLAFMHSKGTGKTNWISGFRRFVDRGANNSTCKNCIKQYLEQLKQGTMGACKTPNQT